jgi:hypothetical protein
LQLLTFKLAVTLEGAALAVLRRKRFAAADRQVSSSIKKSSSSSVKEAKNLQLLTFKLAVV